MKALFKISLTCDVSRLCQRGSIQAKLLMPIMTTRLLQTAAALALVACTDQAADSSTDEPMIRGLKGYQVTQSANSEIRRYPSVVQPAQESKLSFEVGGKLRAIELEVGQKVQRGDVLAEIDPASLDLKVQQSTAALDEANAQLRNAQLDFDRKEKLLEKNYVTQSEFDSASSTLKTAQAQVDQARRQLDLTKEDLSKSALISPFDGVISSIDSQDFGQVAAGEVVLGLYSEGSYEMSFTVPAVIINKLKVGKPARVTFSDIPGQDYSGHIKELGSRAEQISAFPVVVSLDNSPATLRAGMAADVELSIPVGKGNDGLLVPLSSFYFGEVTAAQEMAASDQNIGIVFVFDETSSTVKTRKIEFKGIRENMAIVYEGIREGEIVAAAGVSYLYDGQEVKLLPLNN